MEKWSNKLAVVTGASAGIGAAIVKDLANSGINVVGLARRTEKIEQLINDLGKTNGKMYAYKCDVSDQESVKAAFKWIEEKFGCIHILINNAGTVRNVKILDEGDEVAKQLNEVINTNVTGLVQCTREAFRLMKKSDDYGFIININSVLGHSIPFMEMSLNIYPPTKYAVTAVSEVLRQELISMKNKKIRVSSLSPGLVKTEIMEVGKYAESVEIYDAIPHLQAADISQAVIYLLSTPYNVNVTELTIRPVEA
ncbi:unnamed protein product [Diamesa hyperborea]